MISGSLLVSTAFVPADARAATVTNRDNREHTLTVGAGNARRTIVLKPGAAANDLCPKGCVMRLGTADNDGYTLEGGDVVSVEDGQLFYDEPAPIFGSPPQAVDPVQPPMRGER
ncbi:MAG: hypothetical protein KDJ37_06870 [Hyphomicrobiaceae bacterium]|nr:hypothetical protein [Hyphomicrobiaceae bacterium]